MSGLRGLPKALEMALQRTGKVPPVAMCPRCADEVLVSTFNWAHYEFYCLNCKGHFGWLEPRAAEPTPELDQRVEAAEAKFKAEFFDPETGRVP